ncbi:formate dehydrogenase subunit delta [Marinobacter sp. GN3S48]|uniref:formate dehydrogenase subunit delta n=1 Tax=Marinobacter sp. GN3S48 TaxID=3382302 RepID=UPI00387B6296
MSSNTEHLVKMANQIAENAPSKDSPEATAEAVASHLRKFWAKPMKQTIKQYAESSGEGLCELAMDAVRRL